MAFHVACPITCRRICFCTLGFPQKLQSEKGRKDFLEEISRVEEFLSDPWLTRAKEKTTVQIVVPRILPPLPPVAVDGFGGGDGYGGSGDGEEFLSVQSKRVALQRRAVEASLAAEDYARKYETGGLVEISGETVQNLVGEEEGSSIVKVMCRMCFYGENEGSERAIRMLACKICSKKYHRSCLKSWAQYRDLFHLSSWVCPSCRTCEICRRTGDPTKFMFCKRCDGAYHCYCQHPPHKNVTNGPYLCPKHTRCHSCGSTVPGNGPSTRWFLGYTFCDACGRLFVKGNYCPVCLKVYRDSESTPMVCCDVCQRWVHCECDGISDDKYLQFQADGNLYYKCAACRGECYQVRDPDDAVQELWRRRDKADRGQIANLRAAAGLPTQEDKFSVPHFSEDEEYSPIISKQEYGRSLKFSVKGSVHKAPKNTKEYGKKSSNKKYGKKKGYQVSSIGKKEAYQSFEGLHDRESFEFSLSDEKNDDTRSYRSEGKEMLSSPMTRNPGNTGEKCSINQAGIVKHFIDEVVVNKDRAPKVVQIKNSKLHSLNPGESAEKHSSKSETMKGTKLVIHLGARNRNITHSPRSETSSCHREHDLTASSNGGSEDTSQRKVNDKNMLKRQDGMTSYFDGEKLDNENLLKGLKYKAQEGGLIKLGKVKSGISDLMPQISGHITKAYESTAVGKTHALLEGSTERSTSVIEPVTEAPAFANDEVPLRRHSKGTPDIRSESHDNNACTDSGLALLRKDPKPLLKLKFKNPYVDNRGSWVPHGEEERSSIKGQRSKRKRPSPSSEKSQARDDEDGTQVHQENQINEVMEANWILKKLGKDAIGKRVEVHQPSDNSWHKGVITDVIEGKSALAAVRLDDGKDRTLDLGKQVVRFISQKQKRSKP